VDTNLFKSILVYNLELGGISTLLDIPIRTLPSLIYLDLTPCFMLGLITLKKGSECRTKHLSTYTGQFGMTSKIS